MTIGDYVSQGDVVFLEDLGRTETTKRLIEKAIESGHVADAEVFSRAIFERESILSTAVGQGVAVPHAKVAGIDEFFVAIGISSTPIEWDAPDKQPVRIVFLIGGPENQQTRYLQILAKAMLVVKNEGLRTCLLGAKSAADVMTTFSGL
jgi:PTS system nitrogen regulatory IIA component